MKRYLLPLLVVAACKPDARPSEPVPRPAPALRQPSTTATNTDPRAAVERADALVGRAVESGTADAASWVERVWEPMSETERHNLRVMRELFDVPSGPRWRHIVIHHTAARGSTVESVDRFHRRKFDDPDGIEYHFLIGNGRKMKDGWIGLGRWPLQKRSIHLFKPERAPDAITISLVGNFEEDEVSAAQYDALLRLVLALSERYDIPPARITTHRRVDRGLTACPGRRFPYDRLLKDVGELSSSPRSDDR